MIKLNCTFDNKPVTLFYDNFNGWIYDESHKRIDFKDDSRIREIIEQYESDCENYCKCSKNKAKTTYYGKSKDLTRLKIQLGLKCNMKCSYCAQAERNLETVVSNVNDVDKLIKMLKDNDITVSQGIQLWGGEPFVYWKILIKLIPALKQLYPDTGIFMISNGTLLTKQKIDFLKKYDCAITFSHDGPGYYLRGTDPLDNPKLLELWKYAFRTLKFVSINAVLSPANTNLQEMKSFFDQKFKDYDYHLGYEGVMTHVGVINDQLMFNKQTLLQLQKSIFKAITTESWNDYRTLRDESVKILKGFISKKSNDNPLRFRCDMGNSNVMAINMKGDVLSCHDHCTPENFVGRIEDLSKVDLSKHFHNTYENEKCRTCVVLNQCNGTCPQISGLAQQLTCKNEFAYHIAIFQAIIWLVFGYTIESYEVVEN